jgi:hypothetical protein
VLAQLGADAGQQHRELERLGHVVVGARIEAEDRVGIAVMAGQHQDRAFHALLAHQPAQARAHRCRAGRHRGSRDRKGPPWPLHRRLTGLGLEHVEFLGHHQLLGQRLAQVVVVIDQQDRSSGCPCWCLLCSDRRWAAAGRTARSCAISHALVSPGGDCFRDSGRRGSARRHPCSIHAACPAPTPNWPPAPGRPAHGRAGRAGRRADRRAGRRGGNADAARLAALRGLGRRELAITARRAETLKARAYDGDLARILPDAMPTRPGCRAWPTRPTT